MPAVTWFGHVWSGWNEEVPMEDGGREGTFVTTSQSISQGGSIEAKWVRDLYTSEDFSLGIGSHHGHQVLSNSWEKDSNIFDGCCGRRGGCYAMGAMGQWSHNGCYGLGCHGLTTIYCTFYGEC